MNKKAYLTTLIAIVGLSPIFASAQLSATTTPQANEAQVFTACSQAAIELRDSSIGSARVAYNNAMNVALDGRKVAEKEAVALSDAGEKKTAIKSAVEEYKKAVTHAQESLTKARKEAWGTFEADTKACREIHKPEIDDEDVTVQSAKAAEPEAKPAKPGFFESLKNLFKKGSSASN